MNKSINRKIILTDPKHIENFNKLLEKSREHKEKLKKRLEEEVKNFDPNDPKWK